MEIPALSHILSAHVQEYGELLPHVFMGDVTRFAVEASSDPGGLDCLDRLVSLLEDGLASGGAEIEELIVVSFVENLLGEPEATARILRLAGPALRSWMQRVLGEAQPP